MERIKIRTTSLTFAYNGRDILTGTTTEVAANAITALVGPSGSGKSTFLLTLNRLWETQPNCTITGKVEVRFNGNFQDIYQGGYAVAELRRKVGMVFQMPNPLPMSIFKNVTFPLLLAGEKDRELIAARVEEVLRQVQLWNEVRDRLHDSALSLSGGQQQRLCIARALVPEPEVLLLDEPTSSLDQRSAGAIEELLVTLKSRCTLLVVSHYLDQVQRIADHVLEIADGAIIPYSQPGPGNREIR